MRQRLNILGSLIDKVDQRQAIEQIAQFVQERTPHHIVTANAEIAYMAQTDDELREMINNADLVTADGSGIIWASEHLGQPLSQRVTGIDLLDGICQEAQYQGWKLYFLGAAPGVAQEAVLKIMDKYPDCQIAGYHHGYITPEEEPKILESIKNSGADVIFVAMGAPRQEQWIKKHKEFLEIPVLMGVGGSFDVISGRLNRAPIWMQKCSLEWLYRLAKQPTRWKRALALPKFVFAVKKQKQMDK